MQNFPAKMFRVESILRENLHQQQQLCIWILNKRGILLFSHGVYFLYLHFYRFATIDIFQTVFTLKHLYA
jgi:hypothetical protein